MKSLWLALLLFGCTGLEEAEQKRLRAANKHSEEIYRLDAEQFLASGEPTRCYREAYAWEKRRGARYPRITKEFFRCRGQSSRDPIAYKTGHLLDCGGFDEHSLPLRDQKEFIYPILIDLLNYIQDKSDKRVVITCGHRCPDHNRYAEPESSTSLHMVGAEVDFYVEDLAPSAALKLINAYYSEPLRPGKNGWHNDEIALFIRERGEGRDIDNDHSRAYLTLQVRSFEGQRVTYSWAQASRGYLRW